MKTMKKNPFKVIGLILSVLMILCVLFIAGLYFFNRISLKKESELIHQKGQLVEIDGKNMNIYTEGDGGKTLVFMAGANTPAVIYDFKPLFSQLTDEYKVAVIEKFGYGYSDNYDGDRSLSTMLRQDREALKKAGIKGPYILCPHSASGLEAISWAQQYPDEVEAIIGLDMAVPEQFDYQIGDFDKVKTQTYEETTEEEAFYDFWMYDMGGYRLYPIAKIFPASASDKLTKEEQAEYKAVTYRWYSQFYKTAMFREGLATVQQIQDYKALRNAEIPDVPTLLFVSQDEATFNAMLGENGLEKWKKIHENYIEGLSNGRIINLACGHYVHVEAPEQISNELKEFINDPDF